MAPPTAPSVESQVDGQAGRPVMRGAGSERLLARVLLPRHGDPMDVRALYLDEDEHNTRRSKALSRTSVVLPALAGVSFATYFNAFPASYWRRWTTLEAVELRLVVEGECRIDVYRSKADGTQIHVQGEVIEPGAPREVCVELELTPFEDGGWYWFDLTTEEGGVTLHSAGWYALVDAPGRAAVTIGVPTFNRPTDCVATLAAIASDELLRSVVIAVIVPDQGANKVRDQDGFAEAAAGLGDRLRIIDQANLGGSGGYSRIMYEALRSTDCEQILFMDDDITLEPDSALRAVAFSRHAKRPMLVGGQMLSAQARSHLHSMAEVIDRHRFMWGPAPHVEEDHDFAEESLRESEWLHRRFDVDYNAWWLCLIPRQVAERVGLPLPLFIKWDDAEYGLRAAAAGYPTATVPGIAIWHMSFADKDDAVDWQSYFHLRNRLVVAALHGPGGRASGLIKNSMRNTLKHLLSLQYSTVALQDMAIRDFVGGPHQLFDLLPASLGQVRARRSEFDDGRSLASASELPVPSMDAVSAAGFLDPPAHPLTIGKTLASALLHNLLPVKSEHLERPQLNVAAQDARWFLLARLDGATVSSADGRGVAFRKRDPKTFWSLLSRAAATHLRLAREFPRLRREYRQAVPELASSEAWEKAFEI